MTLLAVTSETWMVTGLGFGMVLVLLFIFVFIMKALGAIMSRSNTPSEKVNKVEQVANATPASPAKADETEMAAVAMALDLYYNSLHDMESPRLTIISHNTMWNKK